MADAFMFSAQLELVKVEKPPDPSFSSKRAHPHDADVLGDSLRKPTVESFKSKLLSASSPDNWRGFGTEKEKLKIEEGDVTVMEGLNGPVMKLSEELKLKLCKSRENALILKNMGRTHTLNFMISKLRRKWPLIGHWQLTDLDDGYFDAWFQMLEDLEAVLTGGPWVIAN
ncbi:hypothetical protein LWI29_024653 [Acer saccharum]|uniref:DUF4283 domain-containing protein n=1 Tax=Acer saccharum TaxID=4024 RepID=A0AA39SX27_ACESA|nr:hypothetical protein LWI29_024653 [Acer saccharum]